jgi:hypothetical protein
MTMRPKPVSSNARRFSVTVATTAFVVAACVALVVLQFFNIARSREETLATARKETANLTISLVQHAELSFRTADASLAAITSQIERSPAQPASVPASGTFWFDRSNSRRCSGASL